MVSSPENSPWAPELGCSEQAAIPVISQSQASRSAKIIRYPSAWSSGAHGCMSANSGQVTASIWAVALSFMVQEPSEIMLVFSDRSRDSSQCRYRSISVSE
jgi:hypothetical protein